MRHPNLRFAVVMTLHTFISAGTYLLGKVAADALPTLVLGLLRFLIAGAGFLLLARLRGLKLWSLARTEWRVFLWLGFLGVLLNQLAFLGGLAFTLPSHAALLYALTPTLVLLMAWIRGEERPSPGKVAGLVLAFAGVALLLAGRRGGAALPPHWLLGDLLILVAVVAWAGYTVASRPMVLRHGAQSATTLSILSGLVLFAPLGAAGLPGFHPAMIPTMAWIGLAYLGIFTSIASYLLWFHALSLKEPSRVAVASNAQPVVTALLGWIFFAQPITLPFLAGAGLVAGGVVLAQR